MGLLGLIISLVVVLIISGIRWTKLTRLQRILAVTLITAQLVGITLLLMLTSGHTSNKYVESMLGFDPEHPLLFTEFYFWAFFLLVMIGFSMIHKRRLMRSAFLMAIGLFFYWKTSGFFVVLLIFSTIFDFNVGNRMEKTERNWKRKLLLALSIIVNLGMLVYFKYAYFFTDSYNQIFLPDAAPEQKMHVINWFAKWSNDITSWLYPRIAEFMQWNSGFNDFTTHFKIDTILLPVGVSFFTFQTISYAVDVYRKELKAVKNIFDFGFFVTYFPQLVAGPIVRATDFIPQIYKEHKLTKYEFGLAIFWILNGLIKKLVLSDYLAANYIDRVFDSPEIYGGLGNVLALLLYSLQVYADFSGYTDIAIGVSLLLGFRLPMNFNSPYKSKNVAEFWRRWHMSLSTWLRDYLYIPLGGNQKASFGSFFWLIVIGAFVLVMPGSIGFLKSSVSAGIGFTVLYFSLGIAFIPKTIRLFFNLGVCIILITTYALYYFKIISFNIVNDLQIIPWYVVLITAIGGNMIMAFISKDRRNTLVTNINLMLTMVIGGLWHGASWNFLIWGALNGGALVVYKGWKKISPYEKSNFFLVNAWKVVFTFVFISFTRLFFRAGDIKNTNAGMETVSRMWKQITSNWNWDAGMALLAGYWKIWIVFSIGMIIHWLPVSTKEWYRNNFAKSPFYVKIIATVLVVFIVYQSITAGLQTFIYFQF